MSAVFAPELYGIANEFRVACGPWLSDAVRHKIFVLERSAAALIRNDHPRKLASKSKLRSLSRDLMHRKKKRAL